MDPNELLLQTINENRHPLQYIGKMLARPDVSVNFANPRNHETALHVAAKRGDVELLKLLISLGAHVNSGTVDFMTPLTEFLLLYCSAGNNFSLFTGHMSFQIFSSNIL